MDNPVYGDVFQGAVAISDGETIAGFGRTEGEAMLDARRAGLPVREAQTWHCTPSLYSRLQADRHTPFVVYLGMLMTPEAYEALTGQPPVLRRKSPAAWPDRHAHLTSRPPGRLFSCPGAFRGLFFIGESR